VCCSQGVRKGTQTSLVEPTKLGRCIILVPPQIVHVFQDHNIILAWDKHIAHDFDNSSFYHISDAAGKGS